MIDPKCGCHLAASTVPLHPSGAVVIVRDIPSIELLSVLRCEKGLRLFQRFLRCEMSEENLLFWFHAVSYRKSPSRYARDYMFDTFVKHGSRKAVNLECGQRQFIAARIADDDLSPDLFQTAAERVFDLMEQDSFRRFISQGTPDVAALVAQLAARQRDSASQHQVATTFVGENVQPPTASLVQALCCPSRRDSLRAHEPSELILLPNSVNHERTDTSVDDSKNAVEPAALIMGENMNHGHRGAADIGRPVVQRFRSEPMATGPRAQYSGDYSATRQGTVLSRMLRRAKSLRAKDLQPEVHHEFGWMPDLRDKADFDLPSIVVDDNNFDLGVNVCPGCLKVTRLQQDAALDTNFVSKCTKLVTKLAQRGKNTSPRTTASPKANSLKDSHLAQDMMLVMSVDGLISFRQTVARMRSARQCGTVERSLPPSPVTARPEPFLRASKSLSAMGLVC